MQEFTAKKKKEAAAERKKKKILRGPTALQQRREQERYLKNMKGWQLVKLKHKSIQEVFNLYQQAKKEMDTFFPMGCARDEEHFAQMNKKLVPEKVSEAELKEAEAIEEEKTSSSRGTKRKSIRKKTFARKKQNVAVQSNSESEDDENDEYVDDYEHIPPEHLNQQMQVLTVVAKREEPEVVDAEPMGIKYPIIQVTT